MPGQVRSCDVDLYGWRRDLPLAMHRRKGCNLPVAGANCGRQENQSRPAKQQGTRDRRARGRRRQGPRHQHRARLCVGTFGYAFLSPPQPTFYTLNFNFDADLGMLNPSTPIVTYSTSADIRRFVDYGHKIIWYHGLSDPGPPVLGTIKYYEDMAQQFGGLERAQQFSRLYPVPNMGHCSGGAATDQFDLLTPLANWVENGVPPGPVLAKGVNFTPAVYQVSFVSGPATRTRPLCPYPQEARFTGNVSLVGGVPVASNPADLADPTKYQCIATRPPHPEKRGDNE